MGFSFLKRVPLKQYPLFLNLQFLNLLLPLISYPYLLRVVGPEKYGLIAIAGSVGAVILTISEYGYSFVGVKDVVGISDSPTKISRYLSNAMLIRGLLFILCSLLLIPVCVFTPLLYQEYSLAILTVAGIFPSLLYPQWLFVGLQKVRHLNYIIMFNRLLSIVLVFVLITHVTDYAMYPLVNAIPACISGVVSIWYLNTLGVRIHYRLVGNIWIQMKDSFYPFVSQSLTTLYAQVNPILLMILLQNSMLVGYYAVGEKIVTVTRIFVSPLTQLYLPHISKKFLGSKLNALVELKSFARFIGVVSTIITVGLMVCSTILIRLVAGEEFLPARSTVTILAPIILIISLNHLAGVHALLNLGLQKEFFYGILWGGIAHIIITVAGVPLLSYNAPAVGWLVSEIIVLAAYLFYIKNWVRQND